MKIGLLSCLNAGFLGYIIKEFLESNLTVDAVILDSQNMSRKDSEIHKQRTNGRLPPIPLCEFSNNQIPFYFVENHNSDGCVSLVKNLNLDILINTGTPRILKSKILNAPSIGVVNCHPGLLPKFRGCTCVEWAVYLDEEVGNTVHFMNEKIDEGPIIVQEALHFKKNDNYVDVRVKVYQHGIRLLAQGITQIVNEGIRPETLPKQEEGSYFQVIDDDKMTEVIDKLNENRYKYQLS